MSYLQKMAEANSRFEPKDRVVVFNATEWSKTGDLAGGNDKYFQPATVLNVRKFEDSWLADVKFDSGLVSNGHFQRTIKHLR